MLVKYFWKHKMATVMLIALLIIKPAVSAWCTVQSVVLFDAIRLNMTVKTLYLFGLIVTVFLINRIFDYWARLIGVYLVTGSRRDVKKDMFSYLMRLNLTSYWKEEPGDYMATFTNDITLLDEKYFNAWISVVEYTIGIVIVGGTFFTLDKTLAAVITVGGIICGLVPLTLARYTSRKNREFIEEFSEFTVRIKELFSAFATIKNYSVEKEMSQRFNEANDNTERKKLYAEASIQFANGLSGSLSWFIRCAVMGVGIIEMSQGKVSFGLVMSAYVFANEQLAMPLHWLIQQLNSIVSIKAVKNKISDIHQDAKKEDLTKDVARPSFDEVRYIDVSLELNGTKILNDVSLTIARGKKYLVVGRNGSGKSTLFKLLKRNNDNFTGQIQLGEREIRELPFSILSSITSFLAEDSMVFTTSVANNISLLRDVDESTIRKAAKTAQVELPLDRILREGGLNISSGERRRIEVARSLINSPDILVFDEVISTLDIETAYEIEKLALSLDETVVFISHNFSGKLIDCYDEILLIDKGQIAAHGKHSDLYRHNPDYRRLFELKHGAVGTR